MKGFILILSLFLSTLAYSQTSSVESETVVDIGIPSESLVSNNVIASETPVLQLSAIEGIFSTFIALVAFIPIAVQYLRSRFIPDYSGIWVQVFSWVVGIIITLIGWILNLGFLDGLSVWLALLYGVGACLAANGIFDTGIITGLFKLVGKKAANE